MIRYAIKCSADHSFDSWFQSAAAYEALIGAGRVTCPICGSAKVEKGLMAPAVRLSDAAAAADRPLDAPGTDAEAALAALRRQIEANSDYVGLNFAAEARRIHAGDAPERRIYGEARADEARALIEDGVPVAPLPFVPGRKTN
ncbi:MAG: DUF1178 family protein [Rhodobacter sp.]|jgi:hypothetical protein|nr:DUF1178 family protein [Rhodobacter sp.]